MRLLDLLVARVKGALLPLIGREMDKPTGYAVAWALCVGCIVAGWVERPEDGWFWEKVRAHLGRWEEREWREMLGVFPTAEGYVWLDVDGLWARVCAARKVTNG